MFRRNLLLLLGLVILFLVVDWVQRNSDDPSSLGIIEGAILPDFNQDETAASADLIHQPDVGSKGSYPINVLTPRITPQYFEPQQIDSQVQIMISQVLSSTIIQYDGDLSGEWPVIISGEPYTITTRYTYSGEPIQKATQFVGEHMEDLGLSVDYHQWSGVTYPNVIGELTGSTCPWEVFIISAHIDDMPSLSTAPGADDNASGSTAVLIAADLFSQITWGSTLRFAFWTGEEQNLLGSKAYAQMAGSQGQRILGVLNLDMIGWNTPDSSPEMELHARATVPGSLELAHLFSNVVTIYDLNLIPEIIEPGIDRSDHGAFWDSGFAAILAIEDYHTDFNPYYHSVNDQLIQLDIDYFTEMVKAAIGTLAHMSRCQLVNYLPVVVQGELAQ